MDIDQARTFLAITANGSFLEAVRQLHLTQSTVSARIRRLARHPAGTANGGSCFLPARMATPFIATGQLNRVRQSPVYTHPAYLVYPRATDSPVLEQALEGLLELAVLERANAYA